MDNNWLLKFQIQKEVEVEKPEEREENGEKVTITKKVKENQPVVFLIKSPTRKERVEQETYTAAEYGRLVKEGATPRAILEKKFQQDGGLFTKDELEEYRDLTKQLNDVQREFLYESAKDDKDEEKIKDLSNQEAVLRDKLVQYRTYDNGTYSQSADEIARARTVNWLQATLLYKQEPNQKDPAPWFTSKNKDKTENLDERLDQAEAAFEEGEAYKLAIDFSAYICTLWLMGYRQRGQLKEVIDTMWDSLLGPHKDKVEILEEQT